MLASTGNCNSPAIGFRNSPAIGPIVHHFFNKPSTGGLPEAPFNVLQTSKQVKTMVGKWQRIGYQQDASEFLLYMLQGIHEESKWERFYEFEEEADEWAEVGKKSKKVLKR